MTKVGRVPARSVFPAFAFAFVLFALFFLLVAPASSNAAKPFTVNINKVKASKGYKASIYGDGNVPGPYLALQIRKGGAKATYEGSKVKVKVSKLSVSIGPRGKINLKAKSKSKPKVIPVPKKCTGKPGKRIKVTYKGKIKFNGEGGYTKINVKKIKGTIVYHPVIKKCKGGNKQGPDRQYAGLDISHTYDTGSGTASVYLYGSRRTTASGKARFYSTSYEGYAKYGVFRSALAKNRPNSTLTYDMPYTTVSITPGSALFSGTATLVGQSGTPTGNLKVNFPGRPNVELVGPSAWATFEIYTTSGGVLGNKVPAPLG